MYGYIPRDSEEQVFMGQMPFLSTNWQCQSTESKNTLWLQQIKQQCI